jgi:hypothetical protein
MTLDFLSLVTCGAEMVHNLQNRLGQPIRWNITAIVKPKGK